MSDDLLLAHVPSSMLSDVLFSSLVVYGVRKLVYVVITCKLCIYEVWKKEILHNFDLTVNSDLLKNVDKDESLKDAIEFIVFHSYTVARSRIYYLIKIFNKLIVLEKNILLKFHNIFENVTNIEIQDTNSSGQAKVLISFANQLFPISTDFSDGLLNTEDTNYIPVVTHFKETLKSLKNRTAIALGELSPIKLQFSKKFIEVQNKLTRLTNTDSEPVPILKFGDFWTKMHNKKLVIGIPVINNTYLSRLTAYNIHGYLISDDAANICYKYNLFKLKNDSYKFDKYEQLLTDDINYTEYPDYDHEWELCNKNILFPETSGIIMITIKVNNLIELQHSDIKCFISYNVTIDSKNHSLYLYIGRIKLSTENLCELTYQPTFHINTEVYADLLTIVSTSKLTKLKLQYNKEPKVLLENCLVTKLKFIEIYNAMKNTENVNNTLKFCIEDISNNMSLFYNDSNIWSGTLIRINRRNKLNYEFKVYSKNEFEIINLLKAIYNEYNEICKIELDFQTYDQCDELKKVEFQQLISNEINLLLKNDTNGYSLDKLQFFIELKCNLEYTTDLFSINV